MIHRSNMVVFYVANDQRNFLRENFTPHWIFEILKREVEL